MLHSFCFHTRLLQKDTTVLIVFIYWKPWQILKIITHMDVTPHSSVDFHRDFGGAYSLHLQDWRVTLSRNQQAALVSICFLLVQCLAYSLILKMKAVSCSEMLLNFWGLLHSHCCNRATLCEICDTDYNSHRRLSCKGKIVPVLNYLSTMLWRHTGNGRCSSNT